MLKSVEKNKKKKEKTKTKSLTACLAQSAQSELGGDIGQLHTGPISVTPSAQLILSAIKAANVGIASCFLFLIFSALRK